LTIAALVLFTALAQAQNKPFGDFKDTRTCTTVPDGRGGYTTVCC
jgi:hypothetical protein